MRFVLPLLGLALVLGAGFWLWSLQREVERLTRRLDRYNRALFDAGDELRAVREQVAATSAELRVVAQRQAGRVSFSPETTMREAELIHPQAHQVLKSFHLGGCESCAVEPDDTLRSVAASKGLPLEQLLGTLNLLVAPQAGNGGSSEPAFVKLPNMTLEID